MIPKDSEKKIKRYMPTPTDKPCCQLAARKNDIAELRSHFHSQTKKNEQKIFHI